MVDLDDVPEGHRVEVREAVPVVEGTQRAVRRHPDQSFEGVVLLGWAGSRLFLFYQWLHY